MSIKGKRLSLPDLGSKAVIASVSGGKDSTAMILALRDRDIESRYVFADTKWEAPETYEYLDLLREKLSIQIDVVESHRGGMAAQIRRQRRFPSRMQRWCTRDLKLRPLRRYHNDVEIEQGVETVSALGVRADESRARAHHPEWGHDDGWGGFVWRPLLHWQIADVMAIHHRHGVPVNPLYRRGHDRVGCYPCIMASKNDIRLVAEHEPARVETIRALEAEFTELRAQANEKQPGRYRHVDATFFQTMRKGFTGIDKVVEWARTKRGGRQLPLLPPPPTGGCARWGLCDPPGNDLNSITASSYERKGQI